ncbi:MAG: ribulose-phosphate 3-epimerase, partial [Bacteroidales bacterium]|nr:ribulose-phosphate 3-epimerase [Bacteroidales bacterium]
MKVAPSILTADFLHLEKDLKLIDSCSDYIHLDIMDGTLVP